MFVYIRSFAHFHYWLHRVAWIVLHDWKKAPMALDASKKIRVPLLLYHSLYVKGVLD